MKKALVAALITLFPLLSSQASGFLLTEARIWQIGAAVEAQAERIRRAQELIENRAGLSKARIEEQLRVAEADLTVQQERLKIMQDELADQLTDMDQGIDEIKTDWKNLLMKTLEQVRSHIRAYDQLIGRMRMLQDSSGLDTPVSGPEKPAAVVCPNPNTLQTDTQCSTTISGSQLSDPTRKSSLTNGFPVSLAHIRPASTSSASEGASPNLIAPVPGPPLSPAPTG